ncbi:hypothetical protein ISN76_18605 [Dyella halodurans]|uniref:ESPR domain-containing protein n=1 Tax=Dyella halodurans TaxID=1920171 RepID=A0ABV9C994_9GAMM|nr:hypothetical protein [Dyella halodurans]
MTIGTSTTPIRQANEIFWKRLLAPGDRAEPCRRATMVGIAGFLAATISVTARWASKG